MKKQGKGNEKKTTSNEKDGKKDNLQSALREIAMLKEKIARLSAAPGSITWRSPWMDPRDDPSWVLVNFALNLKYEEVPEKVVDYAKKLILDTLGLGVGGSATETIPELVELIKGWGGKKESLILIYGGKVPAPNAAFVMGPMIRALDMGDVHNAASHLCEHTIPALVATLGLRRHVTGKQFIAAFIAAVEVSARIGEASFAMAGGFKNPTDSDLFAFRPPNAGDIGSVLGVAKLLNLDEKTTHSALGIQHWAVGARTYDLPGNLMMRYQHAFLSHSAVFAVLLAQRGVTGPVHIFGGPTGYLAAFYPWKNDISLLTKDIGKAWNFSTTSMKAYMGCFFTHAPVTAMEELRKEYAIKHQDIATLEVSQALAGWNVVANKEECWNPTTVAEAQFSLPYTLATMAIYGKVFLDDFSSEAMLRTDTGILMRKIVAKIDEELPHFGAILKVTLKNGKQYVKRIDYPKGHPIYAPMSWDDVIVKFKRLLPFSKNPIPDANAEKVIDMVQNLEKCKNVENIVELLTPSKQECFAPQRKVEPGH
jgi:2-methylcitrate dehydratase PrpD